MRHFFLLLSLLALVGCARSAQESNLCQKSGKAQPIVCFLPVIDNTTQPLVEWDLSREFSEELRRRAFDSQKIYLSREEGNLAVTRKLNECHPHHIPSVLTETLSPAEFVVVTELIKQEETPFTLNRFHPDHPKLGEVAAVLSLNLRLRVIDVRGDQPKVILQELIDHDHMITRPKLGTDYVKKCWGTKGFDRTPMGLAHNKVFRDLVARVEGYVGANHL